MPRLPMIALIAAFAASCFICGSSGGQAAEIKVIAANALKEAVLDLSRSFESASGHKVINLWGGTDAIDKRIDGGEVIDIVLIAAPNIDKLTAKGRLAAGSRVDFAKSGVGIAIRSGLPRPDVSTREGVKNAILNAKSIAYSSGPSGAYVAALLDRLGVAEQTKGKVKQPASGVQIGELLARGDADLGFQQISELLHVKGIDFLGPLPPDIQNTTVYAAGLHSAAPAPDAAKALMKHLTGPNGHAVIKKIGMEPG